MPRNPLGTALGAPLPPDLKKPLKTVFFDLLLEGILKTFLMFFDRVFQVSFSKAFGPNLFDFKLISALIFKHFLLVFEDAGNLEK